MPEYRVLRIEEQMYGCEELPAGQPVLCDRETAAIPLETSLQT